jgi:xanthine/CO dehydrogenase XdhC/CoxF family maturation factor
MIGSRRKCELSTGALKEGFTAQDLERVHAPVGCHQAGTGGDRRQHCGMVVRAALKL